MKPSEFEEIKVKHEKDQLRWIGLRPGQIVWDKVPRMIEFDYHPMILISIDVDERTVEVEDISTSDSPRVVVSGFTTRDELDTELVSDKAILEDAKDKASSEAFNLALRLIDQREAEDDGPLEPGPPYGM